MNWEPYTLQQIWQMLEHETGQTSWAQVTAWGRMKNLCETQAARLRQALDELAALWPPEKSEASGAYRDVVMTMVRSLEDSANAAHMNAKALSKLTSGISATRQKIAHLVEQLGVDESEQAERERNRLPFSPDGGLINIQRSELNRAARQIMSDADTYPAEAVADFKVANPYSGPSYSEARNPLDPGTEGVAGPSGVGGTGASFQGVPRPIIEAPVGGTASEPVEENDQSIGDPVLGAAPVSDPGRPPGSPSGQPSSWNPSTPTSHPTAGPSGAIFTTRTPAGIGPYGVIGATRTPPVSAGAANPGTSGSATGRQAAVSGSPGMMAPMANPGSPPRTASRQSARALRTRRSAGPHDPWFVASGQPAVIEPPDEPTAHDPGPGVIGIDR